MTRWFPFLLEVLPEVLVRACMMHIYRHCRLRSMSQQLTSPAVEEDVVELYGRPQAMALAIRPYVFVTIMYTIIFVITCSSRI
ncbi:hypothetical protein SORBI_3002G156500, partial [Sorghum bicolor]